MENLENDHHYRHGHSGKELDGGFGMPFSCPISERDGGKESVQISLPDDQYTSTTAESGGIVEAKQVEALKKKSSSGSSLVTSASLIVKLLALHKRHRTRRFQPDPAAQAAVVHALKGLKFISKTDGGTAWAGVETRFDKLTSMAKTNGLLPRPLFGECIGMSKENDEEFSTKLFDALARKTKTNVSGDQMITKAKLQEFWNQITNESFDCRLEIFFNMIDKNADGVITEEEVREIISTSASSNELSYIKNRADEYARLMMEELDPENLGYIEVEHLKMLLLKNPKELEMFILLDPDQSVRDGGNENRDLSKTPSLLPKPAQDYPLNRWYRDFQYLLRDNWRRIWVMALWIGVMAGLFAYKYVQYRNRAAFEVMGHCVCMAKGAAETLKLNMALILLPMCRKTITWLWSRTLIRVAVPFNDNINFHKMVAVAVAIGVGIHGISHLACDFPRLLNASPEKYELVKDCFGDKPTSYWHFVKGWEGWTGIVMVILMAVAFTFASPWFRRDKLKLPKPLNKLTGFNVFWYSHHLFIIVYALLIIHGIKLYLIKEWYKKTTWMYLAIPVTLYAGERLTRSLRSRIKAAEIRKVAVYPGDVLALHMSKPQGFRYKSGQYIFVKCPALSPFEWHPFSITSAPSDEHLSVHIRVRGDWTGQLKKVFSEPSSTGRSGVLSAALSREENNPSIGIPRVLIDGPYGAPTQDYKDYEVVLLIGLGIGATPMISVLKDIINNIKDMEDNGYNNLEKGGGGGGAGGNGTTDGRRDDFKLKKAYFYWVTKEQGSFEWFKSVMNEVAQTDHSRVIEIHSHCTSVYKKGDARCALIAMLQSIIYAKNGMDIVSGTSFKSHFGRPKWEEVYQRIARKHPDQSKVGVFFCGAPQLVEELKHLASEFSHKTTSTTRFEFHKENF